MTIDYIGVTNFIELIREAEWTRQGAFEYLWLDMHPDLEPHLPDGVVVEAWGDESRMGGVGSSDGLVPATLRRDVGGWG